MIAGVTEEMHGSDRVPDLSGLRASLGWNGNSHRERNGALLRVHAEVCSKTLDTADIVREAICHHLRRTAGVNGAL